MPPLHEPWRRGARRGGRGPQDGRRALDEFRAGQSPIIGHTGTGHGGFFTAVGDLVLILASLVVSAFLAVVRAVRRPWRSG